MAEKRLNFRNEHGENLVGILVQTDSRDLVLLCHGFMANKDMCHFPLVASTLAERGLSSFRFDHPCCWNGESERKGEFLIGNHEEEVEDMKCAVRFLRSQGWSVVCLLGHSKGGTNALMYAATVGDFPSIINLSGRYFVREGLLQRVSLGLLHIQSLARAHKVRTLDLTARPDRPTRKGALPAPAPRPFHRAPAPFHRIAPSPRAGSSARTSSTGSPPPVRRACHGASPTASSGP